MKFLRTLIIAIVVIIVAAVVISLFLPSEVRVERTATLNAPISKVFANVNTLHEWPNWSPWHQIDTNMKTEYSGEKAGVGAKQSWSSDHPDVGVGSTEIIESETDARIKTKLVFAGENDANGLWEFSGDGENTTVTWAFEADMGMYPIAKFFGLMMDGFVGPSLEKGLVQLGTYTNSQPNSSAIDITIEEVESQWYIGTRQTIHPDSISSALGQMYGLIGQYMGENKIEASGMPFTLFYSWSDEATEMEAAIPVNDSVAVNAEGLVMTKTRAGESAVAIHTGPYEGLEDAYMGIEAWLETNEKEGGFPSIQWYLNDPADVQPSEYQTKIMIPIVSGDEMTADSGDEAGGAE